MLLPLLCLRLVLTVPFSNCFQLVVPSLLGPFNTSLLMIVGAVETTMYGLAVQIFAAGHHSASHTPGVLKVLW